MCAKCEAKKSGSVAIDWSRIPAGLDEVRRSPLGSQWATPNFRVTDTLGHAQYQHRSGAPAVQNNYGKWPVVEQRPELKKDYLIQCPGIYPDVVRDVTKKQLQDYLAKSGYGPDIRIYELKLVAEAKKVEVVTTETQLIWS